MVYICGFICVRRIEYPIISNQLICLKLLPPINIFEIRTVTNIIGKNRKIKERRKGETHCKFYLLLYTKTTTVAFLRCNSLVMSGSSKSWF